MITVGLCILIVGFIVVTLTSCASTLTYNSETKVVSAKDYTVQIDPKTGIIKASPNRWFNTGFLNQFFGGLFSTVHDVAPVVGK